MYIIDVYRCSWLPLSISSKCKGLLIMKYNFKSCCRTCTYMSLCNPIKESSTLLWRNSVQRNARSRTYTQSSYQSALPSHYYPLSSKHSSQWMVDNKKITAPYRTEPLSLLLIFWVLVCAVTCTDPLLGYYILMIQLCQYRHVRTIICRKIAKLYISENLM